MLLDLFQLVLHLNHDALHAGVLTLAAEGVDLAADFLGNEAQFLALSRIGVEHVQEVRAIGLEPHQLFGHVELFEIKDELVLKAVLVDPVARNVGFNVLAETATGPCRAGLEQGGQFFLQFADAANPLAEIPLEDGAFLGPVVHKLLGRIGHQGAQSRPFALFQRILGRAHRVRKAQGRLHLLKLAVDVADRNAVGLKQGGQLVHVLLDQSGVDLVADIGGVGFEVDQEVALAPTHSLTDLLAQGHFVGTEPGRHAHGQVQSLAVQRSDFHRVFPRPNVRLGLSVAGHGQDHAAKYSGDPGPPPTGLGRYLRTMADLATIRRPVDAEMKAFQGHFKAAMKTSVPLLDHITRYIVRSRGKQMRPLLVYLSAAANGETQERTHVAATLIELLHTATLVHDDVVDAAETRRGFFSIQALWKSKIAVLVGDYLLSRGLLISMDRDAVDLLRITSKAVEAMSEGELLQIEKARRLDITEEVYYDIIRRKTASLIAACCAAGAASAGADEAGVKRMHAFGEAMGIAFQIKDDLLDFTPTSATGKPKGGDLKERKMTLPLIHDLQSKSKADRRRTIRAIKRSAKDPVTASRLLSDIQNGPGMAHAEAAMRRHRDEAVALLDGLPDTAARQSLIDLVDFTISRNT